MSMRGKAKFDEFEFLDLFYEAMIEEEQPLDIVRLTVDARLVGRVYAYTMYSATESELRKLADICLANDWIEHAGMGTRQYADLRLTTAGVGIAVSKRKQKETIERKYFVKRLFDYIEAHKGIFLFVGVVIILIFIIL